VKQVWPVRILAGAGLGGSSGSRAVNPVYQTRQELAGYMGWPLVQLKALPNSS